MNIPKIPAMDNHPNLEGTILDLLKSISQEESAISRLINSEAIKISAFVGKNLDFPTEPTSRDILEFNQSICRIIDSILMKEWLLLKKLETVIGIKDKLESMYETVQQFDEGCFMECDNGSDCDNDKERDWSNNDEL